MAFASTPTSPRRAMRRPTAGRSSIAGRSSCWPTSTSWAPTSGWRIASMSMPATSVAWCPTSNARLGSGIAPARELLDGGVRVGLAVDGSASNDSGNMLAEVRQALLMTRARLGPAAMTAREALRLATRGGAACLGRDDIGSLEVGKRADIALFSVEGPAFAGAEADPVAALVFCAPGPVRHLFVDGKRVVKDGQLINWNTPTLPSPQGGGRNNAQGTREYPRPALPARGREK